MAAAKPGLRARRVSGVMGIRAKPLGARVSSRACDRDGGSEPPVNRGSTDLADVLCALEPLLPMAYGRRDNSPMVRFTATSLAGKLTKKEGF